MSDETKANEKKQFVHDVFISYAHDDLDVARNLAEELKVCGLRPWFDVKDLKAGSNWKQEIRKALENSRYCIVILSPTTSASKPWVSQEWASIQECSWRRPEMPICSLRIEDSDPPAFLREWQSVRCNRNTSDVRSAADKIAVLLLHGTAKEGDAERNDSDAEAQQRFAEIEHAVRDLAQGKGEESGE